MRAALPLLVNDSPLHILSTYTRAVDVWLLHQREKKKYDKSRANYDAAVLKVRSINAKKGQVNLEKLAEAEDERDRLKEVPSRPSFSSSSLVSETMRMH